jgi:hypothetical protein
MLDIRWLHQGKQLTLDVRQTQPEAWGLYRLPSLILLVDGKPVRVAVEQRESRGVVEGISRKPKKIEVDPNGWWLLQVKSVNGEQ